MRKKLLLAAVATSSLLLTAPLSASAQSRVATPTVTVLNSEVGAPFSLAVNQGRVYVADSATGVISKLVKGSLKPVITVTPQPSDIAGLDLSRNGRYLAYTKTVDDSHTNTSLEIRGPFGSQTSADLAGYEATVNPDKKLHYGVDNPSQCVKDAFENIPMGPPVTYAGAVDSHPYAVASYKKKWVVADAGGNDLLWVDRKGTVSTLAVLPRQPLFISKTIASALGLPACVVGITYSFEAVPTDVEVGPDGYLYVSTLVGGPEDPSLGARSRIYRVDPNNGHITRIGTKFLGATNLAVDKKGDIYVTELYAGRVSKLTDGTAQPYVDLPGALAIEAAGGSLYASTFGPTDDEGNPTGPGTIVKISK